MSDPVELSEVARLFRVTEKGVRDWIKSGCPVKSKGSQGGGKQRDKTLLVLEDVVDWYFAENFERLELDRQRTRLASEQAQKIAIENTIRLGEIGELGIWLEELEKHYGEIRSTLLALPTKLAPQLTGDVNDRKDTLERAVHEALRKLAAYRPSAGSSGDAGRDPEGGAGSRTSSETDGLAVGGPVSPPVKGKRGRARRVAH